MVTSQHQPCDLRFFFAPRLAGPDGPGRPLNRLAYAQRNTHMRFDVRPAPGNPFYFRAVATFEAPQARKGVKP
jgi:hypothetical protein